MLLNWSTIAKSGRFPRIRQGAREQSGGCALACVIAGFEYPPVGFGAMKIYTRTGDDGTTGLYFGGRVDKNSARPTAYGDVDELQAWLGVARAGSDDAELDALLVALQHDLWVVMADLATAAENRSKLADDATRVSRAMVDQMEPLIDRLTERFELPAGFVVPGGTPTGAALDVARTVARRAERSAISVDQADSLVVPYLNRLSDLLWTKARWQDGSSVPVRSTDSLGEQLAAIDSSESASPATNDPDKDQT